MNNSAQGPVVQKAISANAGLVEILWTKLQRCRQRCLKISVQIIIIQTMKCFALESFNSRCQAEHAKINSRLKFNPGLALIAFWTTWTISSLFHTNPWTISSLFYLTIRLQARNFYEVIVNEGEAWVNYHFIEIESE